MMPWPWVSRARLERERELADQERAEVRRLTDVIIKLRRRFDHAEPKKAHVPADPDAAAVQVAEQRGLKRHARTQFISRAMADLVQKGANPADAGREAMRLYEETSDLHPAGG